MMRRTWKAPQFHLPPLPNLVLVIYRIRAGEKSQRQPTKRDVRGVMRYALVGVAFASPMPRQDASPLQTIYTIYYYYY